MNQISVKRKKHLRPSLLMRASPCSANLLTRLQHCPEFYWSINRNQDTRAFFFHGSPAVAMPKSVCHSGCTDRFAVPGGMCSALRGSFRRHTVCGGLERGNTPVPTFFFGFAPGFAGANLLRCAPMHNDLGHQTRRAVGPLPSILRLRISRRSVADFATSNHQLSKRLRLERTVRLFSPVRSIDR